jgi:hypothetical protein
MSKNEPCEESSMLNGSASTFTESKHMYPLLRQEENFGGRSADIKQPNAEFTQRKYQVSSVSTMDLSPEVVNAINGIRGIKDGINGGYGGGHDQQTVDILPFASIIDNMKTSAKKQSLQSAKDATNTDSAALAASLALSHGPGAALALFRAQPFASDVKSDIQCDQVSKLVINDSLLHIH